MNRLPKSCSLQISYYGVFLKYKYILFTFLLTSISLTINGQIANYVNNPSFEITIPSVSVTPWDAVKFWGPLDSLNNYNRAYYLRSKTIGSVPYNSTGFQQPRTGNSYILTQFYCDTSTCGLRQRGYPRNRLKQSLKPNIAYCVKYHIVNTNNCVVGIDSYGAFFGAGSLDTIKNCMIPLDYLSPQITWAGGIISDTLNWVAITGTFVSVGTEKYMVLGNYNSNLNTQTLVINPTYTPSYGTDIYIDDVSLIELELPAFAGRDTTFFVGDSIFLGREPDVGLDEACQWFKYPDMANAIDTIAGIWVKPVTTTTYVVRQQLWCSGVKWDTVVVYIDAVGIEKLKILNDDLIIFPQPASDKLELRVSRSELFENFNTVIIYNNLGQAIREEEISFKNNSAQLIISDLPSGVYSFQIRNENLERITRRFVVAR